MHLICNVWYKGLDHGCYEKYLTQHADSYKMYSLLPYFTLFDIFKGTLSIFFV